MSRQCNRGRGNEPWRNQERHYCEVCNAWMGSDRQSILIHENGKKHKEAVERAAVQKRQTRVQQEQAAAKLQASLQAIESAALQSHANDLGLFTTSTAAAPVVVNAGTTKPPLVPSHVGAGRTSTAATITSTTTTASSGDKRQTKQDWQSKKQQRQEEKQRKREKDDDDDENDDQEQALNNNKRRRIIAPDEGHYTVDGETYLEGIVFGDMLEVDMPVEIWTGNLLASRAEQQLPDRQIYWKTGLVTAVRKRKQDDDNFVDHEDRLVVDVAYLREPSDTEETLDKNVPLRRIRIRLGGGDVDDNNMIPDTLEAARLLAMGGQEEIVMDNSQSNEIDDATGLTAWSTVSIKKTTVHQECKEERERLRQKRREAAEEAERIQREADRRRMEEAKVANADDSALGAYDVWSRSKEGYKGVDIHGEAQVQVHELGKKLADGKTSVAFKKKTASKKKKQNRRTASADDD